MPSQLFVNEAISFVCAKNFKWRDTEYHLGDDFPQEEANNVETMIRSRFLIPVVDDLSDKPRHWHREVRVRDEALARLHQEVVQIVIPEQLPAQPEDLPAGSQASPEPTPEDTPAAGADGETSEADEDYDRYDPGSHTVAEVEAYIEAHPDQAEAVLAAEEAGKHRKGIVEGY